MQFPIRLRPRGTRRLLPLLALPLLLPLGSCVATTADLRELADQYDDLAAGVITEQEFADGLHEQAEAIEQRWEDLPAKLPSSPIGWLQFIAGLGVTGAGAIGGTNAMRNRARKLRGEPVKEPRETYYPAPQVDFLNPDQQVPGA